MPCLLYPNYNILKPNRLRTGLFQALFEESHTMEALRIAAVALCFLGACSGRQQPTGQLVWSDEFDVDGLLDPQKWAYDVGGYGWGNHEAQFYAEARPENAVVRDGKLFITAVREAYEGMDYTSARITTQGKAGWRYGRFEIRAKLPDARGTWPAIWMIPADWDFSQGGWPDVGEIDIMEHVGWDPGKIHASAHSRDYQWQKGTQKTDSLMVPDATKAFHTYALEWSAKVLRASVDGKVYFEYENEGLGPDKWPYDKPFALIMNIAVGGAWGGIKGIDAASFPQTMEVDYVRVYQ